MKHRGTIWAFLGIFVAQAAFAFGQSADRPVSGAAPAPTLAWADDTGFLNLLGSKCADAVATYREVSDGDRLEGRRGALKKETDTLFNLLNRNPNRKNADGWVKYLRLKELQSALATSPVTLDVLEKSLERFDSGVDGLEEPFFQKVRQVLRGYVDAANNPLTAEDRKTAFVESCDELPKLVGNLVSAENPDAAERITLALNAIKEYQPDSPDAATIASLIRRRFSVPNFQLEVGSRVLFSDTPAPFRQEFPIAENIRGTDTRGNGTATGGVRGRFVKNDTKAEIRLILEAQIATRSVGYNDGATVQSVGNGRVTVQKPLYFLDSVQFGSASATSQMDVQIVGIDSGRGPIGTHVVNNRVAQEFPYSKAESQRRMEQRFIDRLDQEVNRVTAAPNGWSNLMKLLRENDYAPRLMSSWTSESRLYWRGLIGTESQLGPSENVQFDASRFDMGVKMHQSVFNNAAFFALPGERLNDQDFAKRLETLFPAITPGTQRHTVFRPILDESGEPVAEEMPTPSDVPFVILFSEEMPLTVSFHNDQIVVTAQIDQFEQEEKTFPGLHVEIIYALEQRGDSFVFVRRSLDAWPGEIGREVPIPARYQAFRTQLLKRLDEGLSEEYDVKPIELQNGFETTDSEKSRTAPPRGVLQPSLMSIQNGWFLFGADYLPATANAKK